MNKVKSFEVISLAKKIFNSVIFCMKVLPFVILIFVLGCSSAKHNFPKGYESQVYGEMNAAKECIKTKGISLKEKDTEITVKFRDGEKRFPAGWAWRLPPHNYWVHGIIQTYNYKTFTIEVARNPTTKEDINWESLRHEFGHYWLLSNLKDHSHDGLYSSCFRNWRNDAVRTYRVVSNNFIEIIHYVK